MQISYSVNNMSAKPTEICLRKVSENLDFVYWSEENGFEYLADYFAKPLVEIISYAGFTSRYYAELLALLDKFDCGQFLEGFD